MPHSGRRSPGSPTSSASPLRRWVVIRIWEYEEPVGATARVTAAPSGPGTTDLVGCAAHSGTTKRTPSVRAVATWREAGRGFLCVDLLSSRPGRGADLRVTACTSGPEIDTSEARVAKSCRLRGPAEIWPTRDVHGWCVMEDESVKKANGPRHLYLVRHAEARKNVEGRQGGQGSGLTAVGQAQARRLGAYLAERESYEGHKAVVYAHLAPQVRQTATTIAGVLGWRLEEDERLRGLHLGRLAGLTWEEARDTDPAAVKRLHNWARGSLRIDRLGLPGSEDLTEFRERVAACLDRVMLSYESACAVIVGTTSTLIMLRNLLILGPAFSYAHYRAYSFPNGAVCRWTLSGGLAKEDEVLSIPSTERGR
jgi:broad specificity phosphatase PhoE